MDPPKVAETVGIERKAGTNVPPLELAKQRIAVSLQINERVSVEAALVHLSHAKLFGRQNPGLDNLRVRVIYRFR